MRLRNHVLLSLLILLSSCSKNIDDPIAVQIRHRNMQTRSFHGWDAKAVSKQLLCVLQDEGYMVKTVNTEIGLLTAEQDTNIEKFGSKFFAYIFSGRRAQWKKHALIELTSNITEETGRTSLRVNFLVRIFDNKGRVVDVQQIKDETIYKDFFNKMQKGLIARQGEKL